jgi:membrane associated rhomboid family serine protease
MRNITPVVKNLLILNILVFLASMGWGYISGHPNYVNWMLGLHDWDSPYFKPIQFISHMFLHSGFLHILMNMYGLFMFGAILEQVWGGKRFFIYYFVTGLGAALIHLVVQHLGLLSLSSKIIDLFLQNPSSQNFASITASYFPDYIDQVNKGLLSRWDTLSNPTEICISWIKDLVVWQNDVPSIGASGAIFGILLAFGMLFPNTPLMFIFIPIPIKAKFIIIGFGIYELVRGVLLPGDGIAHFAHLGGMLFGFIMIRMWRTNRGNFY